MREGSRFLYTETLHGWTEDLSWFFSMSCPASEAEQTAGVLLHQQALVLVLVPSTGPGLRNPLPAKNIFTQPKLET